MYVSNILQDVWRRVDKLYLDRTFNGQDWFGLRQAAVKKDYKTTADVYNSIKVRGGFSYCCYYYYTTPIRD